MNNGCRAGDTIIVKSGNKLVVDLGKDTTVCPGESVVLKPVTSATNYLWSTGDKTQQIMVSKPGKYWLKMDNGQCVGSDTIMVFNNPLPAVNLKDTLLLCGDNAIWVDIYKPGQKYVWSNGSKSGRLFISEAGKYYVQIEENGCVSKDSVEIRKMPLPVLDLGKDTFLCGDFNIFLDAGEWKSYLWKPDNSTERGLHVNEYGQYIVKVFTEEGCETSDTINILQECDPQLWVPNVFTPYNDDVNNTFKAVGHDIATFEMKIYNRWGELLYVTHDINKGWDGVFKGVLSQMDVYLWTITYTGYHTNKYIYGTVTLLR
jgi:gliding motility-associated-like protein